MLRKLHVRSELGRQATEEARNDLVTNQRLDQDPGRMVVVISMAIQRRPKGIVNMETASRGYLLSGDSRFLAPWDEGLKEFEASWQEATKQSKPKTALPWPQSMLLPCRGCSLRAKTEGQKT